jgi:hypothetical protein
VKLPINGVPFPGHRGTRIPDPAAQRITSPAGGNGNGNGNGRRVGPGCAFIVVFVLTAAAIAAAIVAYTLLTR